MSATSIQKTVQNINNNYFNIVKPMAISSITSPPLPNSSLIISTTSSSSSSSSYQQSAAPSPPESPTYRSRHHQHYNLQQHRYSYPYYSTARINNHQLQRTSSMSSLQRGQDQQQEQQPLSLQERRQRNKAASAKYRAKKIQQHGEMRSLINSLSKENDLLQRHLEHARRENHKLKQTCDQLRGKMLAEKMLKKLLNDKDEELADIGDDNYDTFDDDYNDQPQQQRHSASATMLALQRFNNEDVDQDIDLLDDEDENEEEWRNRGSSNSCYRQQR